MYQPQPDADDETIDLADLLGVVIENRWLIIAITLVALLVGIALLVGAMLAYLTPVGGIAVLIAGAGALLMLRDVRWALFALLGVICLLPFASLPFSIGFKPTFLDAALGAIFFVWIFKLVIGQQERELGVRLRHSGALDSLS